MWAEGRRRGGAKDLARHLQKTDENESVAIREIEGFAFNDLTGANLEKALKQMEAVGYAKGDQRNLYHAIISPAHNETLNAKQQAFMVAYYAEHMGFKGHQYVLVEHWKKGKQHFHLVFNIIDPATGKTHELKWTKYKEWRISRGLEEIFGFTPPQAKGKPARVWETQRGKRSGIDPVKMRKEVTAIFRASTTARDFADALNKAGYTLTRGNKGQLVLVDSAGDTHGLMRRIEGKELADLKRKFPELGKMELPAYAELVRIRKANKPKPAKEPRQPIDLKKLQEDVQKAYRASTTGAEFFVRLNRKGYSLHRGLKGFAVVDANGDCHDIGKLLGKEEAKKLRERFPDLAAIRPRPIAEIFRRLKEGQPGKAIRKHPIRRAGFMFGMAARLLMQRGRPGRSNFTGARGPLYRAGFMALLMRLMARAVRTTDHRKRKGLPFFPRRWRRKKDENIPDSEKIRFRRPEMTSEELLAWAWANGRFDILAQFEDQLNPEP